MNTITFYLEDYNDEEVNFNGETLTFTLPMNIFYFHVFSKSFRKFKSDSYCVGERHWSATTKIYGGINSKGSKVLIGYCSIRYRKKSMIVSDNTTHAEGLGSFFKNLGRVSAKAGEK